MICLEGKLRPPVVRWLVGAGLTPIVETWVCGGQCDVVGVAWNEGRSPDIRRLIAVELKLHDAAGVLLQATRNRYRSHESWAAMEAGRVDKMTERTRRKFSDAGIGLMAVSDDVRVVVPASPNDSPVGIEHFRRKLWRRRDQWKTRLADELSLVPQQEQSNP